MEKYTKTLEKQDLNDFVLETLAWINYRRRWLIPDNKKIVSLSKKYAVSERVVV